MLVRRAYKHKLRLTSVQEEQCRRFAGCARLIYNAGLEQRRLGFEVTGRSLGYQAQLPAHLREAGANLLVGDLADVAELAGCVDPGSSRWAVAP